MFLTTILALTANFIVFWLKSVWIQYRNPMAFYKELTVQQNHDIRSNIGESVQELSKSYDTGLKLRDILSDKQFIIETIILILFPLPINPNKNIFPPTFTNNATNWITYGDSKEPHSDSISIPYLTSDIFLATMTFRVYFILKAVTAYSPMNHLFGRRICFEAGFEADFFFLLRVGMQKFPIRIYGIISLCFIFVFATCIRIFERPYYAFVLEPPTYDFKDYGSATWFTIMTMLSAGYGDMIPATPLGRVACIITLISGTVIVALMIALVADAYQMDEVKITATAEIQEKQLAVKAVRSALEMNVMRQKRIRMLNNGEEDSEFLPSLDEILYKRDKMED